MNLGKYFKTSAERKRYSIDYTDWLDTGETVLSAVFTIAPASPLEVDAHSISSDGTQLVFFVNDGTDEVEYVINVKVTTSGGQIKEDEVIFEVRDL